MKKLVGSITLFTLLFSGAGPALADARDSTISALKNEFVQLMGADASDNAESRAREEVDALIGSMEGDQYDAQAAIHNIETQVRALALNSSRKDDADDAIEDADHAVERFADLDAKSHIDVVPVIAGAMPYVVPDDTFQQAQDRANEAITEVRRIMINPDRPGAVPEGDIIGDFIPMIVRQLFRFAWLAVFVALTVCGVFFIIAHDNEDRLTKAKSMLYFTLIGSAFVAFAFAIVKAVTDIDFFRFI